MTDEKRQIWNEKYDPKRGLMDDEITEFDYLMIIGGNFETKEDIEYQKLFYKIIDSIIHNENIDFISKLDKLKYFTDTNKSLKLHSRERWEF